MLSRARLRRSDSGDFCTVAAYDEVGSSGSLHMAKLYIFVIIGKTERASADCPLLAHPGWFCVHRDAAEKISEPEKTVRRLAAAFRFWRGHPMRTRPTALRQRVLVPV
jgi:hypothetical protein